MEASITFTGVKSEENMSPNQAENTIDELSCYLPGNKLIERNFISSFSEREGVFALDKDGNGSDMDISEDCATESRVTVNRKDSIFSVPLIRVEDWSSSESDMEDDFDESVPPFSFVGTREKTIQFFTYEVCISGRTFNQ